MTNERAIQILEILISIEGDVIIEGESKEALEMAIRSLQQEQPCEDLEKEFQEFCKDYPFPWSSAYINAEYIEELCKGVAKHFYELGKGSQPQLPATLDEAAEEYERSRGIVTVSDNEDCRRAFKAGAKWQKQQDESRRMANIKLANTDVPVDTDMEIAFNDIWQDCEVRVERDGSLDEETTEAMKALCHDFFESGKEWQKEQMMKEVTECELVCFKGRLLAFLPMKEFRWAVGDKAHIIIVKEDKK